MSPRRRPGDVPPRAGWHATCPGAGVHVSPRAALLAGCALSLVAGCEGDDVDARLDAELTALIASAIPDGAEALRLPSGDDYDAIPQDERNPLTAEKIALGQLLFHETALGIDAADAALARTYSCASCHNAAAGFQAGRHQGIGEGGTGFGDAGELRERAPSVRPKDLDVQPVRSPTILHAGYQRVAHWNGEFGALGANEGTEAHWTPGTPKAINDLGYEGVESQAIAGLAVHRLDVDEVVLDEFGYRALFDAAFGHVPIAERYTRVTAGLAIAAYERTVLANRAPFQRWLAGEAGAMIPAEKRGAIAFFGDGGCAGCHAGPALSSETFHALGLADLHDCPEPTFGSAEGQAAHLGRGGFTLRRADRYAFKTPQLYNLADSRFYGHGASLRTLREVVAYKNHAVAENGRVSPEALSPHFVPLGLSDGQVDDLAAFLESGLRDPELARYAPESTLSGSCFPNADAVSRRHAGCP